MVQLKALSGKQAGTSWVARRFPLLIGRAATAQIRCDEPGVWEEHVRLDCARSTGVTLKALPNALVSVNGEPVTEAALRNGDMLEIGGLKLQFWLSETRQRPLIVREILTWIGIGLVSLGQIFFIYWLLS